MTMNRQAGFALVLLALFLGYGYQATLIQLFPGQETAVFSPRTMPLALAIAGALLSALQAVRLVQSNPPDSSGSGSWDWLRAGLLCLNMIVYGLLFEPLGFLLATTVFLATGFAILGERRWWMLSAVPAAFTAVFYASMTQGLGLYLAPGIGGF